MAAPKPLTERKPDRDALMREAQERAVTTRYAEVFGALMTGGPSAWAQATRDVFRRRFWQSLTWLLALSLLGLIAVRPTLPGHAPFALGVLVLLGPAALLYNVAVRAHGLYAARVWGTLGSLWAGCWTAGFVVHRLVSAGGLGVQWLRWEQAAPAVLVGGALAGLALAPAACTLVCRAQGRWPWLSSANYVLALVLVAAVVVDLAHGAATGVPPLAAAPFGGLERLQLTLSRLG